MRNFARSIAAMPFVVNIGLVLAILGIALPMIGVGGPVLGWTLVGIAALLIVSGLVGRTWPRVRSWIERAKRMQIRSPITFSSETRQPTGGSEEQAGVPTLVRGTDERPLIEDDELKHRYYNHRSIWMGEFARKTPPGGETQAAVSDRTFYDCDIYGPVVFGPLNPDEVEKVFVDCNWIEDEGAVSWLPAEGRQEYIGAVRLKNCRFERCRLSRIGVLKQESPSPVQRLETEKTENEQLRGENERANTLVDEYREREIAQEERKRFRGMLRALHEEGVSLRGGDYSARDTEVWEKNASGLIEEALGGKRAYQFLAEDPTFPQWGDVEEGESEVQIRMALLLNKLRVLIGEVDSLDPLELRSESNVWRWRGEQAE